MWWTLQGTALRVPLVLVVREAGDKVKLWEVWKVRGLLAVEGQREEFRGQHCRHCDGVERVRFGHLVVGCMRKTQLQADYIIYTYVVNQQMQIDQICFSFINIHIT